MIESRAGALDRRAFLRQAAALTGLAGAAVTGRARAGVEPSSRPNVLLIVADDMGFSDAGCYGGEIRTPTLDGLATRGLRFTQMYSAGRCWPSRACILTGYYAQQVRMDPPKGRLPAWARLIPHYLKPAGYRCYHAGKWHLHGAPMPVRDGGFNHSYKLADQDRFFSPRRHWEDDKALPPVKPDSGFYATTEIADRAIAQLRNHAEKHAKQPFFEYLAFTCPHFPLQALQEDIARYEGQYAMGWDVLRQQRYRRMREARLVNCALSAREPTVKPSWNLPETKLQEAIGRDEVGQAVAWESLTPGQQRFQAVKMAIHAAMIDRMDREIGRVLKQVRQMGAADNTLVLFVSDNGASAEQIIRGDRHNPAASPGSWRSYLCLGPGWSTAANTPFRRHKSWVHEGGIASPFIVHWPAGLDAHDELRHNPGHFVDLLPTILELTGTDAASSWRGKATPPLPGRSLAPALKRDNSVTHEYLFFHHAGNRALRAGNWKAVSAGRDGPWELYDLSGDRCESEDLSARHPDTLKRLVETWQQCETRFRRMAASDDWQAR